MQQTEQQLSHALTHVSQIVPPPCNSYIMHDSAAIIPLKVTTATKTVSENRAESKCYGADIQRLLYVSSTMCSCSSSVCFHRISQKLSVTGSLLLFSKRTSSIKIVVPINLGFDGKSLNGGRTRVILIYSDIN